MRMPPSLPDDELVRTALKIAQPLSSRKALGPLVEEISRARLVMLGEASHGTQEFYELRRAISEELIAKHGFRFIAVEGDWPACAKINEFIRTTEKDEAESVLANFSRWPTWMWANTEIAQFMSWLRTQNTQSSQPLGFHGLDIYSLFESIDAVLQQLSLVNPFLARRVKNLYECFERFHRDEKSYAQSLFHFPEGCEQEVALNLKNLLEERLKTNDSEFLFDAEQNARIVVDAEKYYRTMIHGNEESWNVRDHHMLETLKILLHHYGEDSKAIIWAHNTHVGDYRATDMPAAGLVNLGGLARETWGNDQVALVGFGTYEGSVTASHAWDGPTENMILPQGRPGSWEAAFHKVASALEVNEFFLSLKKAPPIFREVRGHRAVGVVYRPEQEQLGNYVPTSLSQRYDAFVFANTTSALEPLRQKFLPNEIPETWPQGM